MDLIPESGRSPSPQHREEMATHSNILAGIIPLTEEPGMSLDSDTSQ